MESTRLFYFCTVVDCGSIRKASEILRISPAALSKSIKLLEENVGEKLLLPDGRGIQVSAFGQEFAKQARPLLFQLENLFKPGSIVQRPSEIMRVGTFEVFSTYFFGSAAKQYFSNIQFELRELIPGLLEKALIDHHVDYGITYLPIPTQGIEHIKVGTVQMRIFGLTRHFAKRLFSDLPFAVPISPVSGSPTKVHGLDGWPDSKVPRHIGFRVTLMESALELCRQGLAVGYFPSFVIVLHNAQVRSEFQLGEIKPPSTFKLQSHPVYIAKRKSDTESQALRSLAKSLRCFLKVNDH